MGVFFGFQHEAEEALAEALPALEAARLALDDLDKSDVTEIRYFLINPNCALVPLLSGLLINNA